MIRPSVCVCGRVKMSGVDVTGCESRQYIRDFYPLIIHLMSPYTDVTTQTPENSEAQKLTVPTGIKGSFVQWVDLNKTVSVKHHAVQMCAR